MVAAIPVPFNPATYNSTTNAEGYVVGGQYTYAGDVYRFCKNVDAVSISAGMGVCVATATASMGLVTADRSGGSDAGDHTPAGVCAGAVVVLQNSYFFALCDGLYASALDVGVSIGAATEVMASSTDGKLITKTGTLPSFGTSRAASAGGVFPIRVKC